MKTSWKTMLLAALGTICVVAADESKDRTLTVVVYDYAGVHADTLLKAEQEASRIFRHSGVDIMWRPCRIPDSTAPLECPDPSPTTPALRLVARFQPVADRVRVEAMGFATGDFATVSVEFTTQLQESGVGRLPEILGHVMAHEIGHLLLPRNGHSVSGIMRGHWGRTEWSLIQEGKLNFAPEQARFMRAELARRFVVVTKETR